MDEYEEIIKILLNLGIYGWIENEEIILNNISICAQNKNLKLVDINKDAC